MSNIEGGEVEILEPEARQGTIGAGRWGQQVGLIRQGRIFAPFIDSLVLLIEHYYGIYSEPIEIIVLSLSTEEPLTSIIVYESSVVRHSAVDKGIESCATAVLDSRWLGQIEGLSLRRLRSETNTCSLGSHWPILRAYHPNAAIDKANLPK